MFARVGEELWNFYIRVQRAAKRRCLPRLCQFDQKTLVAAFARLIPERREFLLMHSSLSRCGHIQGGADAVIDGLLLEQLQRDPYFLVADGYPRPGGTLRA
jgi:hypothetical protein